MDLNEADNQGLLDRSGALFRVNFDSTEVRQISEPMLPASLNGISPDGALLSVT